MPPAPTVDGADCRWPRCALHLADPGLTTADLARAFSEERSWSRAARRLGLPRGGEELLRGYAWRLHERAPGRAEPPPPGSGPDAWADYRRAVEGWFAGLAGALAETGA